MRLVLLLGATHIKMVQYLHIVSISEQERMKKPYRLEDYDEEITRVWYKDMTELKRYKATVDRVVFSDSPRVKEIWHIVKETRKDEEVIKEFVKDAEVQEEDNKPDEL